MARAPLTANFTGVTGVTGYDQTDEGVQVLESAAAGTNQQQVVGYAMTDNATSGVTGSFTLSFEGDTTGDIPSGATPSTVQTDLAGLASIGAGNVRVTGPSDPTSNATGADLYTITFDGALAAESLPPVGIASSSTSRLVDGSGQAPALADWIITPGARPADNVQQLTVAATSGSFTLTFENATATLSVGSTAATVQSALDGLSMIGAGRVVVAGGPTSLNGTGLGEVQLLNGPPL